MSLWMTGGPSLVGADEVSLDEIPQSTRTIDPHPSVVARDRVACPGRIAPDRVAGGVVEDDTIDGISQVTDSIAPRPDEIPWMMFPVAAGRSECARYCGSQCRCYCPRSCCGPRTGAPDHDVGGILDMDPIERVAPKSLPPPGVEARSVPRI